MKAINVKMIKAYSIQKNTILVIYKELYISIFFLNFSTSFFEINDELTPN